MCQKHKCEHKSYQKIQSIFYCRFIRNKKKLGKWLRRLKCTKNWNIGTLNDYIAVKTIVELVWSIVEKICTSIKCASNVESRINTMIFSLKVTGNFYLKCVYFVWCVSWKFDIYWNLQPVTNRTQAYIWMKACTFCVIGLWWRCKFIEMAFEWYLN